MWNMMFLVAGGLFILLLFVVFYSKEILYSEENQSFKHIMMASIFMYFVEIPLQSAVRMIGVDNILVDILSRLYLVSLVVWYTIFTKYVFVICLNKNNKEKYAKQLSRIRKILILVCIISILFMFILPMEKYYDTTKMYTYGAAVDGLKLSIIIYMITYIIMLIINFKHLRNKKYLPIFGVLFFLIVNTVLQSIDPSILIASLVGTFICYTMYFTIENPDLKMVNELYKNKSIMEQTYEDKSNFLFEITQSLKEPMLNIKNTCDEAADLKKVNELKDALYKIKGYSKELDFVLNEVLNTNSVTSSSVKFIDNKYSIERLYDEIVSRINPVIPKNVKFSSSIAHNIPTLYGDSIKIKQVVMSLLQNSVKHTTNGFIDFQIDTIERFDAIRLIITIRDSSEGMSIDKINEVLTMSGDLDVRDIEALEQSNINMKLCQKVVKLLGGNMLIKSYDGKGSEILLVIDQKKAEVKENAVEAYESYSSINKTVCVVNQDKQYDNILRSAFKKNNISSSFLLNGNDLIDKVKSGKKYDYIIVGNEMKGINGLSILQELKSIKGFKTPVIIIINEEEERIAKHFLEEGFANYIITNNFAEDLNTIINKY